MDTLLLSLIPAMWWQYINLVASSVASVTAAAVCMNYLDAEHHVWTGRRMFYFLAKWPLAYLSCAFAIVFFAEIEVVLQGDGYHTPTEIIINVAMAVTLSSLVVICRRFFAEESIQFPTIEG